LLTDKAVELRRAGLDRLNISLDTLDRTQFQEITRRDGLQATLDGIAAAKAAGFDDIRLNAVAVKGLIESQIIPLVRFAIEHRLTLRFIEFMPLNSSGRWHEDDVLTGKKIREIVEQHYGEMVPVPREDVSQPATDFQFANGSGQIGFISSVSEPFCGSCNRLRITADGKMRNCLFSHAEWDLRGPIREGAGDELLESIILESVAAKKKAHGIGEEQFRKPERAMYQIGG
jgi:GTP 3',8-cyclase